MALPLKVGSFCRSQVGWNADQKFESQDFVAQTRQAFAEHRCGRGARPAARRSTLRG